MGSLETRAVGAVGGKRGGRERAGPAGSPSSLALRARPPPRPPRAGESARSRGASLLSRGLASRAERRAAPDPRRPPMPGAPRARGPPQRCAAPPSPAGAGPGPGPGWRGRAGPQGGRGDAGLAEEPRALPAAAAGRR